VKFNTTGDYWVQGDFNSDGIVNGLDFNSIATNFGVNLPSSPALVALVPEPGSLLFLGFWGLFGARRSAKSR
jgi:hypothetical protein